MEERPASDRFFFTMICPHCKLPTLQELKGKASVEADEDSSDVFLERIEYSLLQCGGCGKVSLQEQEQGILDLPDYQVVKFAYPAQRQLSESVPESLRREFDEARTCFDAKAYTATVVMVRRTLEGICKENDVTDKTLAKGIERMRQLGLIDDTLTEWADGLRVVGNQGAHYTGMKVSAEDAGDSIHFAEALVEHIYVLRKRFDEFKSRRSGKEGQAPETPA